MQAQMTPATAPGIAGLMQGKPQSPTAGLGNVPQRIGAYGEKGLEQKNTVTQDLLDLMAAQKLKAEKEAAARQMQLQAAQQGQPLTVAQSLDKELLDMTKQQMAPQQAAPGVAQASQQQEQQKQAALQRLAQGITRAPGADQVMPQRMAGGGIVAFQNRGEVPLVVDQREVQRILRKAPMMRTPEENETLRQAGMQLEQRRAGPDGIIQRAERGLQQAGPAIRQYLTEGAQGLSPEELEQRTDAGAVTEKLYRMLGGQQARPPVQLTEEETPSLGVGPTLPAQVAPLAEQPPAPPARPSGPGIRGLGAAPLKPQGLGQGISVPQGSALPQAMQQAPEQKPLDVQGLLRQTGMDEETRAAAAMERAKAAMARSPEEEQFYKEKLARLQKPEPEKRWYERLAELAPFLSQQKIQPGQQGIIGGLSRIATAGMQMDKAQKAMADQRQAAEDAFQEAEMKRRREERLGIYQAGEQARAGALEQQIKRGQLGAQLAEQASQERRSAAELAGRTDIARQDRLMQEKLTNLKLETQKSLAEDEAKLRRELASIKETGGDQRAKTMQRYYESWEKLDPMQKADLVKQGIKTFNDYTRLRDAIAVTPVGGAQSQPTVPAVGAVMQGYRFKGGDPSDRKNWEKV